MPVYNAYRDHVSRDIQGSYICVFQKFQLATLPLLNNRIEDEEIIRKTLILIESNLSNLRGHK